MVSREKESISRFGIKPCYPPRVGEALLPLGDFRREALRTSLGGKPPAGEERDDERKTHFIFRADGQVNPERG